MVDPREEAGGADPEAPLTHAEELPDDLEEAERRSRRRQFAIALIVLLLSLVAIALRIRGHRHLTQLKSELQGHSKHASAPMALPPPRPGGEDPILMTRSPLHESDVPEFLSATLLPGRGMNVFQITASLPGTGEVPLLSSPSLADANKLMSGKGSDLNGQASATLGGAFVLPWAGRIHGNAVAGNVETEWDGRTLALPAMQDARGPVAMDGLLLARASDSTRSDVMPDGGLYDATFSLDRAGTPWFSKSQATVSVLLSGRAMDLTVTVRNTGSVPEPIGIGWIPHLLLAGDRNLARLHLPDGLRVEERANGRPTGRLLPVEGTPYDFTSPRGVALADRSIDASFVHLRTALLERGPAVEILQPDRGYGIRLTALTPNIRAIRIIAPADKNYISIQPAFNYDDPFGREWLRDENTGMVVLEPGQTTQWKLRMEIFSPSKRNSSLSGTPQFDPPR